MEDVVKYIKELMKFTPFEKDIKVYGWEFNYDYHLISSVVPFLFKDLDIVENIAPITNENRDGRIKPKYYIVIHDTGDTSNIRNAFYWSEVVRTMNFNSKPYRASFQYVVGTDGIYHNIPDDEIAYHAGDSTKYDYELLDTFVFGDTKPIISIKEDGYYYINDKKTIILAPKDNEKILDTSFINDYGILCKNIEGSYFLGHTYFNQEYQKIVNRGGNNNGIGIETCINEGSDIYLNFQTCAKLVAHLLDENSLTIDSVKPHHYFSGKDCPMTLRKNNLWDHFIFLVEKELEMLQFIKKGYHFKLIPNTTNIDEFGRITDLKNLSYSIEITYKDKTVKINSNL